MFKLIDQQPRSKLNEGRNYGLGFGMCRRDGDTLITVDPITACKDFCSDRVWVEHTGRPFSIYGLSCTQQHIFTPDSAYMVISILKRGVHTPAVYPGYKGHLAALAANWKHMQEFVNWFEERFGVKTRTEISMIADNMYAVELPVFWTEGTYLISLYTLLLRCALNYTGGDPMAYLEGVQDEDTMYINSAMPKIRRMLDGFIPKQDLLALKDVHNTGVVNFAFPPEPVAVAQSA